MAIKIKLIKIDGQERVPSECMRLLTEFAGHRDCCDQCGDAFKYNNAKYCITGEMLLEELCKQPEVEIV